MSIHYQQYTDTFSILNYLQNHRLWRKNGQKLVLYYLENSKLPTKSLFVAKKNGQDWYYIIQKIIERAILASHVQCLLQKQTSHRVAGAFKAIPHKGDILSIRTCGDFYVSFVYRHCHEQSTCHIVPWIFRQSILSTINNSTTLNQVITFQFSISRGRKRILHVWFIIQGFDWLIDWLFDWLIDWLIDWLTGWLIDWLINSLPWVFWG